MRVLVSVTSAISHGRKFWLKPGQRVVIGGKESSDVVFPAAGLAPNHFFLACDFTGCTLGSVDGEVQCNGKPVTLHSLSTGDRILAGELHLTVEITGLVSKPHHVPNLDKPSDALGPSSSTDVDNRPVGRWRMIRQSKLWAVLEAIPAQQEDPFVFHRMQIAEQVDSRSGRAFRLLEPGKSLPEAVGKPLFFAQHLGDAELPRLSISLQEMSAPIADRLSEPNSGFSYWLSSLNDEQIGNAIRLAGQGRGDALERSHPDWMILNANPNDLASIFAIAGDAYVDNLMQSFYLIAIDCRTTGQLFAVVDLQCHSQWSVD